MFRHYCVFITISQLLYLQYSGILNVKWNATTFGALVDICQGFLLEQLEFVSSLDVIPPLLISSYCYQIMDKYLKKRMLILILVVLVKYYE